MRRLSFVVMPWVVGGVLLACNGLIGTRELSYDPEAPQGPGTSSGGPGSSGTVSSEAGGPGTEAEPPPQCVGVDTSKDPKHCGACNHDCFGGACEAGRCKPVQIMFPPGRPFALGQDAANLYFASSADGKVYRLPKFDTANPVAQPVLVKEVPNNDGYELLVDGTSLYVGTATDVQTLKTDGTGLHTVATSARPSGLAADATKLYWVANNADPERVETALKSATNAPGTQLPGPARDAGAAVGDGVVHVDGADLYWTEGDSGNIGRCKLPGCTQAVNFISGVQSPIAVATNSTTLFYLAFDEGTLYQVPKNAAAPATGTLVVRNQALPAVVISDDKDVYWINYGFVPDRTDGAVRHCPVVGGKVQCAGDGEVLFSTTDMARGLVMDDKAVYWTVEFGGAIYRLAR
jgi:hypothetical protein